MLVLVCGGRDYAGDMECMLQLPKITMIIQGGAKGADLLAKAWARSKGIPNAEVEAYWDMFGKSAGHRRNASMLLLEPGYCVAFPGGRGTQNMVDRCIVENVTVWRPYG